MRHCTNTQHRKCSARAVIVMRVWSVAVVPMPETITISGWGLEALKLLKTLPPPSEEMWPRAD